MSEIDQVHLRAVMLFMSETSEIVIICILQAYALLERQVIIALSGLIMTPQLNSKCGAYIVWSLLLV